MRLFLYEHITATRRESDPLYCEGRAMRDALREDLSRIPGIELVHGDFDESASIADACILIAPETDGILESLARRVLSLDGKLFSSLPDAIQWAADKLVLARLWHERGIPTPPTTIAEANHDHFPAVLKPRDGAGSEATWLIRDANEYAMRLDANSRSMIVQPWRPGEPASIAFLVGPIESVALMPTRQRLSDDGCFQYLGGELPLPRNLAERAVRLGKLAIEAIPSGLLGYVGVDLLLGEAEDGHQDFAIELNPRLTSSYLGLRSATRANLAEAMLRACVGSHLEAIPWHAGPVYWDS